MMRNYLPSQVLIKKVKEGESPFLVSHKFQKRSALKFVTHYPTCEAMWDKVKCLGIGWLHDPTCEAMWDYSSETKVSEIEFIEGMMPMLYL
jgi:hypothetical protein